MRKHIRMGSATIQSYYSLVLVYKNSKSLLMAPKACYNFEIANPSVSCVKQSILKSPRSNPQRLENNNCREDLLQIKNNIMVKSISKLKLIVETRVSTFGILIKDQFNSFITQLKSTHKGDSNRKIFNKAYVDAPFCPSYCVYFRF